MDVRVNHNDGIVSELLRLTKVRRLLTSGFRRALTVGLLFVLVTSWYLSRFLIDLWGDMHEDAVVHFMMVIVGAAVMIGGMYYAHRFRSNLRLVDDQIEIIDQVIGTHG